MAASSASSRQPSGTVLINGTSVPWLEWSVTNNTYYSPDKYSLTVPASSLPAGLQRADLANMAEMMIEVRASLDTSSGTSLIIGRVDEIEDDLVNGVIRFEGRDRTADFIEAKTTEKFVNQTASQIVTTLAGRHGLTADVTATSTKAGRYYEIDHDKLTDQSTEWDLLTYLAQKEGFNVWVTGTTVQFHPDSQSTSSPIPIVYSPPNGSQGAQATFTRMSMHRSLTLASDVTVTVYSWNAKTKNAFKVTAKATKTKGQKSSGSPQVYTFRVPGLTKDQAQQLAQKRAEDITRHERVIEVSMPGDVTTTARDQLALTGTGTAYDQTYWFSEIERTMAFEGGFEMHLKAKNHSPQSTVTA
jgi:phage protein D